MKSKTADSWADFFAELERENDEAIAEMDKRLAVSEEECKALLASLEAEPLPELDLDLDNLDKLLAASEEVDEAFLASLEAEPMPELDFEPLQFSMTR
ncbi:hypothetical protein [Raoultella terrigena]|uniref:hypothetical protein n=1 Tax=Raoultella terrigena TaxID=577 RepID=UPI001F43D608|nr:hypothetical protein [Raoultella terrigena]